MKALVVEKPNSFAVRDVPYPEPGPGEVTVRVKACCVCGTDWHLIKGDMTGTRYPMIPGHEFAGPIDKLGPGVKDLKVGDMVSMEGNISCGYCSFCQSGQYNVCPNGQVIGLSGSTDELRLDGGFAEYVTLPRRNVYLFKKIPPDEASFFPNLNTVVYGQRRAGLQPGATVLIIGAGTMGLLHAQVAKASGASLVAVTDKARNRLDLVKKLGADVAVLADDKQEENLKKLTPYGFDLVVECVGHAKLLEQCFRYVRSRGKILVFGLAPKDQTASINPFDIAKRNLEIIGSMAAAQSAPAARDLLEQGLVKIAPLITHRFPLAEFEQALAQSRRPEECIRVVVEP